MTGQLAFDLDTTPEEHWAAYFDDGADDDRDRMWAFGLSSVRRSCLYRFVQSVVITGGVL